MKGMFKPKRIIALLLSIALCLSLLPGVEVAEAEEEHVHNWVYDLQIDQDQATRIPGWPFYGRLDLECTADGCPDVIDGIDFTGSTGFDGDVDGVYDTVWSMNPQYFGLSDTHSSRYDLTHVGPYYYKYVNGEVKEKTIWQSFTYENFTTNFIKLDGAPTDPGAYMMEVIYTDKSGNNYRLLVPREIVYCSAAIGCASATKVYGAADPAFTFNTDNFVDESHAEEAKEYLSKVGIYTTAANGKVEQTAGSQLYLYSTFDVDAFNEAYGYYYKKGGSGNNMGQVESGYLTITQRPVTISAGDVTISAGDGIPADAVASANVGTVDSNDGLANGWSIESKIASGSSSAPETWRTTFSDSLVSNSWIVKDAQGNAVADVATAPTGTYTLIPADAVIKNNSGEDTTANYDITYEAGTLTIGGPQLTITAEDSSKTYGDADPELTYTYKGLLEGHELVADSVTVKRVAGDIVGTYDITVDATDVVVKDASGNDVTDEYGKVTKDGTFTINPRPVTVTANDATKVYGDADPATFGYTVDGLRSGDSAAVTLSRAAGDTVGEYSIIVGEVEIKDGDTDVTENYKVTKVDGTFTITKRPLTVRAENKHVAVQTDPENNVITYTQSYRGTLASGDEIEPIGSPTSEAYAENWWSEEPGNYPIVPAKVNIKNSNGEYVTDSYEITYVNGTLAAVYTAIVITIPDQLVVNGPSAVISLDYTLSAEWPCTVTITSANEFTLKNGEDTLPYKVTISDKTGADSLGTLPSLPDIPTGDNPTSWVITNREFVDELCMMDFIATPTWECNIAASLADDAVPKYAGEYTDILTFTVDSEWYGAIV